MRRIVAGGTVVTATDTARADVLIEDERIVALGELDGVEAERIDAAGCYVLPGLIDNHTHLAMPYLGAWSADDYDTGTRAAAAGGVTCIVDFALQRHPGGLRSSLEEWHARAAGAAHVDYGFHMAITQADDGTLADMRTLVEQEGVTSFKLFMAYRGELMVTDDLLLEALWRGRELDALVMVHAENGFAIDRLVAAALARGETGPLHHALTRPELVETEATARAIRLAELAGAQLFVVHVSCRAAAQEIAAAQLRGAHVSGETCIQYLFNSIEDLERPDGDGLLYVCSPPLREAGNHEALWQLLRQGVIESCSSDHCAFTRAQKQRGADDFSQAPNGLATIQHRLPKMWEAGVREGRMTPSELVEVTSTAIARRFGLERKGSISPGLDADLVIFDPHAPFTFSTESSHMNVDYDLYDGETVAGSVRQTLCRGTTVFEHGRILTQPGHGRFVERQVVPTRSR